MYSSNTSDYEKYSSSSPYPPSQFSEQPTTGIPVSSINRDQPPAAWSSNLFACLDDVSNCCITCWCPCITFGQIAEIVDKGTTSCGTSGALYALIGFVTGCSCIYSCFYRSKMRRQFHLRETPCNDCLVHCFCEGCALCQEYRELKSRGFDMISGWHGNMGKPSGGVAMAPVVQQEGMSRQEE